jgi:predicted dinucleotide-binding enzyme
LHPSTWLGVTSQSNPSIRGYGRAMNIGIVGSNERAVAIGRLLRGGGHHVTFGDPAAERAKQAAAMTGTESELPYRQAMCSDLLVFALPRNEVDRAVTAVGSGSEAVIVDVIEGHPDQAARSGAEMLAHKLDTHRVVRALINLPQPGSNIAICGDDALSKELLDKALRSSGCITTDRGPLAKAVELEPPVS